MTTPIDLYRERLASGQIDPDPLQERAAGELTRLQAEVIAYERDRESWRKKIPFFGGRQLPPRGIYLYGPVGRGKSMLMDIFHDSIPFGIKKRRVHFHQFMIEVHDFIHRRRTQEGVSEDMDAALPALAEVISNRSRVLCFDEFHVTDVADAMLLGRLFTALLKEGVTLVLTSNWAPDDLYQGGLQRDRFVPFIELIKQCLEVIALDSPIDYRARKLREMSVYFSPFSPENFARAEDLFLTLSEGAEPSPGLIEVKGRTIEVPVMVKGIARFSFAQLCERPLGAEDYLAIAKRYHTIFLENVPRLAYDRRNEAKRLMTLVDVLYDTHRNLVITAEEPPHRLYVGHDHAFEFQRTVSRLLEMQTPAYLNQATKA